MLGLIKWQFGISVVGLGTPYNMQGHLINCRMNSFLQLIGYDKDTKGLINNA